MKSLATILCLSVVGVQVLSMPTKVLVKNDALLEHAKSGIAVRDKNTGIFVGGGEHDVVDHVVKARVENVGIFVGGGEHDVVDHVVQGRDRNTGFLLGGVEHDALDHVE